MSASVLEYGARVPHALDGGEAKNTVGTAAKKKKDNYSDARYGLKHGGSEESHAQQMNAMGSGRYAYLNDFYKDLNKGPVKLDFAEKPMSEKERQAEEARAESAAMMSRAMVGGGVLVLAFFGTCWQLTKWYFGIKSVWEFNEVMQKVFPKVSNDAKDSMVGRQLSELSEASRDAIADNESLAAWRRQVRQEFNTPEGAALARKNSIMMAERRAQEKLARDASRAASGSVVAAAPQALAAHDESPLAMTANLVRRVSLTLGKGS
ncbi:hypothetical protein EMIHUDRAFT_448964 [Emiliania huxleyi CCMP1516]|uniref:Uncharacterized protein n=2 Tax=Emiliania huxleyi TaxID=2903 RepID=A0A0D3KQL1_EMIH1|nr:hypothetical protein EMIHUDRAFT_448964 [Emiliania huxleyi CCMP1516]EOD38046.1 hypothetical protein EMIHUDRAFT_448964 [Emiliania huxleyi CCMP1516]|eukprot:XP_005790475.1 hypothetical protein EMIHUDRAFT_448964 [Emiliania huxleyi CCMP1516]